MKHSRWMPVLSLAMIFCTTGVRAEPEERKAAARGALIFAGVEYQHRWSKDNQHEYAPRDQADLEHWSDMITINYYPSTLDGEGLARTASAVLEAYKQNRAIVIRTNSVPRTEDKPAEHFIMVLFPRPDFIEAVFARFKLIDGVGTAAIYSHRIYGQKIGDQMSRWLEKNGPELEKALMNWDKIPAADAQQE